MVIVRRQRRVARVTALATLVVISMGRTAIAQDDFLEAHRWVHRLLLVFTPSRRSDESRTLESALADAAAEVADRDLLVGWFSEADGHRLGDRSITPDVVRQLRSQLDLDSGAFAVLLIGKDGGIKARYAKPPALSQVFMLIDRMPMRRAERRSRGDAPES